MVAFLDIVTLIISTLLAIRTIKKVGTSSRYIIYFFFFIVMIIPLYLDYLVGKPIYTSWLTGSKNYGFIISFDDAVTRIIYDVYILLFQFIILNFRRNKLKEMEVSSNRNKSVHSLSPKTSKGIFSIMIFLAVLPVVLVLIVPINNNILLHWGWRDMLLYGAQESPYYFTIEKLSYLGEISALLLLFSNEDEFRFVTKKGPVLYKISKILWILLAYFNVCIESKRSIIIFILAIVVSFLVDTIPRKKMFFVFAVAAVAMLLIVALSVYIKINYRTYTASDAIYTTLRIDYFRDDTTKMLIYSIFHPEDIKVLDFPGQSYLSQIGYIFPLDIFGTPRLGYNTYFTCALLKQPLSSGLNYTTTSMYDELIANFSFLGFIIAPVFSVWYARIADKQSTILKTIMIAGYVLLVMYPLNYIMWFLEAMLILLFFTKYKIKWGNHYLFK